MSAGNTAWRQTLTPFSRLQKIEKEEDRAGEENKWDERERERIDLCEGDSMKQALSKWEIKNESKVLKNKAVTYWDFFSLYITLPMFVPLPSPIKYYLQPNIHCGTPVIIQATLN